LSVCGVAAGVDWAEVAAESVPAGLGSETATVLGGGSEDCPEAEVVKNGTDVNANATETLINARDIDT
jgi:hypothetical protein